VGCVVWLSSSRFDDNDQDKDHPPSLRGTMRPGIVGGSARGEASWVPLRATTGHDKR
jgi:hypothetical protein